MQFYSWIACVWSRVANEVSAISMSASCYVVCVGLNTAVHANSPIKQKTTPDFTSED